MKIVILIAAIVSNYGSSQVTIPFDSMASCQNAATEYKIVMKKDGAPNWTGDSGVIVKTMCVETKK